MPLLTIDFGCHVLQIATVCFLSFVIFYDDVTLKVVEIIDFRKKFLKGMVDAFYDV